VDRQFIADSATVAGSQQSELDTVKQFSNQEMGLDRPKLDAN
jgi:hypothetical protein